MGNFYFIPTNEDFADLKPQTATRLIYLNTFLNYDDNTIYNHTRLREPLRRAELADKLKISKAAASQFFNEVSPKYLSEDSDGAIHSNNTIFHRGKIDKSQKYAIYQKFYTQGVRKLYEASKPSQHKNLGYIFKLLPYINLQYNVLCFNPFEQELNKIEFMMVAEFCEKIHYSKSNINKLISIYKSLRFDMEGQQQKFIGIVNNELDYASGQIFINPRVLFCGDDFKRVEVLGAFCRC